ncbi:hypothetical protein E2P81_ATG09445 [Venturia nashicola]|uniref:Uncharacterized protein n=1 Tax=Venturia nashicola TaxID=86259 RepID=A0A4Z1P741_9PEZI|nr:hypothetical protein E6O75_ATG09654 [Venturia nashicola]TLD25788.1 hypothetical protein E2P81_ATG09445 [Venturia nashicola]
MLFAKTLLIAALSATAFAHPTVQLEEALDKRSPSNPRKCGTPKHPVACDPPSSGNKAKRSPGDYYCRPGNPNCIPGKVKAKRSPTGPDPCVVNPADP